MIWAKSFFFMRLHLFSSIAAVIASVLLAPAGSAQEFPYLIFARFLEPLAQTRPDLFAPD